MEQDMIMNSTCTVNNTLDLRNTTYIPLWLIYLPNEWIVYMIWPSLLTFGVLSNVSFIWAVTRTPTLHTSTYYFLVSFACANLCNLFGLGLLHVITYAISVLRCDNMIFQSVIHLISIFTFLTAISLVTLVSLERYLAICYPIKHHLLKGSS